MFLWIVSEVKDRVLLWIVFEIESRLSLNIILKDLIGLFFKRERENETGMRGEVDTTLFIDLALSPFYTYMKAPHSSGTRTRNKWKMYMSVEGSKTQRPCH